MCLSGQPPLLAQVPSPSCLPQSSASESSRQLVTALYPGSSVTLATGVVSMTTTSQNATSPLSVLPSPPSPHVKTSIASNVHLHSQTYTDASSQVTLKMESLKRPEADTHREAVLTNTSDQIEEIGRIASPTPHLHSGKHYVHSHRVVNTLTPSDKRHLGNYLFTYPYLLLLSHCSLHDSS